MPYSDPQDKLRQMRRWRKEKMEQGYGKWLYARRKLRFEDAKQFRGALWEITQTEDLVKARQIAHKALDDSIAREQAVGTFTEELADNERA